MISADSITELIKKSALNWSGTLRGDGLLLTAGAPLQPLVASTSTVIDLADQSSIDDLYCEPITTWSTHELSPGRVLLAAVENPLRLGSGLMGMIGGLSHLARVGLAVHLGSPFVLPGWTGHLTLELVNAGPATLRLHHGMPLARLLIFAVSGDPRTDDASRHPFYGGRRDLKSRYADEFSVGPIRR